MISAAVCLLLRHNLAFTIGVFIVTAAAAAALPGLKTGKQKSSWFAENDRSLLDYRILKHQFQTDQSIIAAFVLPHAFGKADFTAAREFAEAAKALPYVSRVRSAADTAAPEEFATSSDKQVRDATLRAARAIPFGTYLINDKADTLGFLIEIWIPDKELFHDAEIAANLLSALRDLQTRFSKKLGTPLLSGDTVVDTALNTSIGEDIARILPLSAFVSIAVLLLFLKDVRRILMPLLAVVCALVVTLGLMALLGSPFTMLSTSLFAVVLVIGVSDAVHIVERHAFLRMTDPKNAAFTALREAAAPCFFTSATTALGFLSLAFAPVPMVASLGVFAAVGIMVSYLFVLILTPRAFAYAPKVVPRATFALDRFLTAAGDFVQRAPRRIVVFFAVIVVGAAFWGGLKVTVDGRLLSYFRPSSEIRRDTAALEARLGGLGFNEIIIEGSPGMFLRAENVARLREAETAVAALPGVERAVSGADLFDLAKQASGQSSSSVSPYEIVAQDKMAGKNSFVQFFTKDFGSARIRYAEQSGIALRNRAEKKELERILKNSLPKCVVRFTGYGTLAEQANQNVTGTLMKSLIGSFSTVFLLMGLIFGLRGGWLSLLPNVGAVAILPPLMAVLGYRLNIGTAIIAAVTLGIVVDDTIHLLWRYKALVKNGEDAASALSRAMREVGRPMTVTSLLFVLGFNVFLVSKLSMLGDFGLLSSLIVSAAWVFDLFFTAALLALVRPFTPRIRAERVSA